MPLTEAGTLQLALHRTEGLEILPIAAADIGHIIIAVLHGQLQITQPLGQLPGVDAVVIGNENHIVRQGSVSVAQEAERGIVDMETLKKTNLELIATLDEVRRIQDDGRARRAQAEEELGRIEGELKSKLLEMKG